MVYRAFFLCLQYIIILINIDYEKYIILRINLSLYRYHLSLILKYRNVMLEIVHNYLIIISVPRYWYKNSVLKSTVTRRRTIHREFHYTDSREQIILPFPKHDFCISNLLKSSNQRNHSRHNNDILYNLSWIFKFYSPCCSNKQKDIIFVENFQRKIEIKIHAR